MRRWCWVLGLTGCVDYGDFSGVRGSDTFDQVPTDAIDVLFVVDDSGSMEGEQLALALGFTSFVVSLEEARTDFHLGVVTTTMSGDDAGVLIGEPVDPDSEVRPDDPAVLTNEDDYVTLFAERVRVGTDGDDQEMGLEAAATALDPSWTSGPNQGFLREDARLLLVFVTDEDDCSHDGALDNYAGIACYERPDELIAVSDYLYELAFLKADTEDVLVAGIIGPPASEDEGCSDSVSSGRRYRELAGFLQGQEASICSPDFDELLFDMGLRASGLNDTFLLGSRPRPDTIEVEVDLDGNGPEDPTPSTNWTYDDEVNAVVFTETAIPPRESRVEVTYILAAGG